MLQQYDMIVITNERRNETLHNCYEARPSTSIRDGGVTLIHSKGRATRADSRARRVGRVAWPYQVHCQALHIGYQPTIFEVLSYSLRGLHLPPSSTSLSTALAVSWCLISSLKNCARQENCARLSCSNFIIATLHCRPTNMVPHATPDLLIM